MKKLFFCLIFLCLFASSLHGCTHKVYVPVERKVEVRFSERDTLVMATLPAETSSVVTNDTTATVSTSVAEATVVVRTDTIYLNLRNRDTVVPLSTKVRVVERFMTEPTPYPVEVVKRERYTAWYDYIIRLLGVPSFIVLVYLILRKKWKFGSQ